MRTRSSVRLLAIGLRIGSADLVRRSLGRAVTVTVDSGGRYPLPASVRGRAAFTALLIGAMAQCEITVHECSVNHRPGVVFRDGQRVIAVMVTRSSFAHVREIWVVANPEKLASWNRSCEPIGA
jgi:RNA polymerase sigma-70 factor (ECF subfamily)